MAPSKKVSQTDPAARWTAAPGGPAYYAYSTNYLIDTEAGIIVDVEATPAHRTLEVQSTKTMIERVKERAGLETKKLIGDTAYGTAEFLAWMVNDQGIEPHVPVWDKGERTDGTFSRSDFVFDEESDSHTCPYKEQCCPNTASRKVTRSVHESAREVARSIARTPAYRRTRRQRKQVEMLFAHMKRILKMDRLRLRGLSGARDEFLLTATAQNLRRMAKYIGTDPPATLTMAPT